MLSNYVQRDCRPALMASWRLKGGGNADSGKCLCGGQDVRQSIDGIRRESFVDSNNSDGQGDGQGSQSGRTRRRASPGFIDCASSHILDS